MKRQDDYIIQPLQQFSVLMHSIGPKGPVYHDTIRRFNLARGRGSRIPNTNPPSCQQPLLFNNTLQTKHTLGPGRKPRRRQQQQGRGQSCTWLRWVVVGSSWAVAQQGKGVACSLVRQSAEDVQTKKKMERCQLRISFAETPITNNQVGREDEIKVPGRHQRLPFIAAARAIIIDNRCVPGSSSRFFSFI